MVFMYIVLFTAGVLLLSVVFAVFQQKKIKVNVIAREAVEKKEFFALRIESDDFLFVRDELEDVSFIQSLDDVEDFSIKDLTDDENADQGVLRLDEALRVSKKAGKNSRKEEKLVMRKSEKKVS